jgi:hypothetical protein
MDISAVLNIIANFVTILGLPCLICSILLLVKQLRIQAYQAIYDSVRDIDQFLVENSDLRAYLYEGKALPEDPIERERVLGAADMLLTFFEHVIGQKHSFSKTKWVSLKKYVCDAYNHSPALQHFIAQKGHWYSDELKSLLKSEVESITNGNN